MLLVGPAIIITYNERAEHRTERQTAVGRSLAGSEQQGLQQSNASRMGVCDHEFEYYNSHVSRGLRERKGKKVD